MSVTKNTDIVIRSDQGTIAKCPFLCLALDSSVHERTQADQGADPEPGSHLTSLTSGLQSPVEEQDGEEKEDDRCMYISKLPGRKERRKELSFIMSRMNIQLHDLNWRGFHKYADDLLKKKPSNLDHVACVAVHKPYALRVTTGALYALEYLESMEAMVRSAPSSDFLMIRLMTMKAFLLYFLGRQKEAQVIHEQTIHQAYFLEACNPTAHNLYYYALNSLLHNRGMWGRDQMPLEATWIRAENCYRLSAEQHLVWVQDLDSEPKVEEGDSIFHFLITFAKYIMCRLRTCAAADGFNTLIRGQRVAPSLLEEIRRNLREIESKEEHISPRGYLYYCLARCDYNLRCYQERGDKNKYLDEADTWAKRAGHKTSTLKEKKLRTFVQTFVDCRLDYVAEKLSTTHPEDRTSHSSSRHHLTPLKVSQRMSHMDCFKAGTCEEQTIPSWSDSEDTNMCVKYVNCPVLEQISPRIHRNSDPSYESRRQSMAAETIRKSKV